MRVELLRWRVNIALCGSVEGAPAAMSSGRVASLFW
jgi:hypothetical protein